MDVLNKIKRLVARGRYRFTVKAATEIVVEGLTPEDAIESILNAQCIKKTLRSKNAPGRTTEKLYVIESFNFSGSLIYTKGKFSRREGEEIYYLLISSKRSTIY